MILFNPPAQLGGSRIDESQDDLVIDSGSQVMVSQAIGEILLREYDFLKEIDETYSPDYYETLNKKPWYKRLWPFATLTNRSGTS